MINLHFKKVQNIGDVVCAPGLYFDMPTADLYDERPDAPVVWGGGYITAQAAKYGKDHDVLWGVGISDNSDLSRFALVGTRDADMPYEWVPCASCMSPLFDIERTPTQSVVEYGHAILSPMAVNNDLMDFEAVLDHLGSGETVITSSYHGMVWATLLGRKVIVKSYSDKFNHWPFDPNTIHDDALRICREANINFAKKVADYGKAG